MKKKKHKTFPPALRACWIKLNSTFGKRLQPAGITPDQYSVLRWIHELDQKAIYQKDLAKLLFTDSNNIASLLNRMEQHGLIRRNPVQSDKRKKMVVATKLGKEKWLLCKQIALDVEKTLTSTLSIEERTFISSTLKQISNYLNNGYMVGPIFKQSHVPSLDRQ
jgi:DNA-binding MarR family transcriptional regulator